MKILCTADIHIGQQAYSKLDVKTGLNTRVLHSLNILDDMIDYAIKNCDMFIFAGDMFKNNLPSPTIQNEVYKRIKRLNDNKIHTILLDGNHDVSKLETTKSSLKAFETFDFDYIHHSKFFNKFTYNNIDFITLPTYCNKDEIKDYLKNLDKDTIIIGHFTVLGAALNDWLIDKNEANISLDTFKNKYIKSVILGHLHKYQILNDKPLIFYTGSPDRIDFGEENNEKGFVVLDTNDYSYQFIKTNAEKFKTIKIDITDVEEDIDDFIFNKLKTYNVKDCIVRTIINMNTDQTIDEQMIYKYLSNAKYLINIQKNFTNKKYKRNSDITNDLSIEHALEVYYENKDRSKERIELGKEIIKQNL